MTSNGGIMSSFPTSIHNEPSMRNNNNNNHIVPTIGLTTSSDSIKIKCIVLGSSGAGKTSILRRYFHGKFDYTGIHIPTRAADFYTKKLNNPYYYPNNYNVPVEGVVDTYSTNTTNNSQYEHLLYGDAVSTIDGSCTTSTNHSSRHDKKNKKKMKKHHDDTKKKKKKKSSSRSRSSSSMPSKYTTPSLVVMNKDTSHHIHDTNDNTNTNLINSTTTTTTTPKLDDHHDDIITSITPKNHKLSKKHKHKSHHHKKKQENRQNYTSNDERRYQTSYNSSSTTMIYPHENNYNNNYNTFHQHNNYDNYCNYDIEPELRQHPNILLQVWDTAGRERFVSDADTGLTSSLGELFFQHAHVAMLIYDATSSRSFLQLIKWYSELLERVSLSSSTTTTTTLNTGFNYSADYGSQVTDRFGTSFISSPSKKSAELQETVGATPSSASSSPILNFPVLVVATKLDIVNSEITRQNRRKIVPQRDVMGFKHFNGEDKHYEYSVHSSVAISSQIFPSSNSYSSLVVNNIPAAETTTQSPTTTAASTSTTAITTISKKSNVLPNKTPALLRRNPRKRHKSGFGLEGSSWIHDMSYLESIRTAEDSCFPDRNMVLLWCRRNGLQHVEVSALEGMGIDCAFDTMVKLALESRNEQIKVQKQQYQQRQYQQEQELESTILQGAIRMKSEYAPITSDLYTDLHMRNKESEDECDIFSCFRFVASWFRRK